MNNILNKEERVNRSQIDSLDMVEFLNMEIFYTPVVTDI